MDYSVFIYTLIASCIIAIGIIVIVKWISYFKKSLNVYLEVITAITVGLLLGIVFLGFIPEIISHWNLSGKTIWIFILGGLLFFYLLEMFLHWHHCRDLSHDDNCGHSHSHTHQSWRLMFFGTLFHNMFHGIIIFSAFSIDLSFGIATSFAILLHSIPQNVVNYIMNRNNMKFVYVAALGGIIWWLLTFPFHDFLTTYSFHFLAIITWTIMYIALADLFPEFKEKWWIWQKILYLGLMLLWLGIYYVFSIFWAHEHSSHESSNSVWETHMESHEDHGHEEEHLHYEEFESEVPSDKMYWSSVENQIDYEWSDIGENLDLHDDTEVNHWDDHEEDHSWHDHE